MPASSVIAVTAFSSAVVTAVGAVLLAAIDPQLRSSYYVLAPGAGLAAVPLALLFWRSGVLSPLKAVLLVLAFAVAFGAAAFAGIWSIAPLPRPSMTSDELEVIVCVVAGIIGAALSLGAFPLLGLAVRSRATLLRITVSTLVLTLVAGLIAAMPFFDLVVSNSAIIWLAAIWQLVYAPLLVWVLRPQAGRSASTM
jgi:hypothetical protein